MIIVPYLQYSQIQRKKEHGMTISTRDTRASELVKEI